MECTMNIDCDFGPEYPPNKWIMTRQPIPIGLILGLYLIFVYKFGPRFMENRPPYSLKSFLIFYNVIQVCACLYIIKTILLTGVSVLSFWKCRLYELNGTEEIIYNNLSYFTLWLKIIELIETILFILRKKHNQVTFLHVFHHTSTIILVYLLMQTHRGGSSMFPIFLNSIVHVIMYSYYLISAIANKQLTEKLLPIKKSITTIQMIQFCFILLQVIVQMIKGCPMNYKISIFYFCIVSIIFYLFYDFYKKSYKKKFN